MYENGTTCRITSVSPDRSLVPECCSSSEHYVAHVLSTFARFQRVWLQVHQLNKNTTAYHAQQNMLFTCSNKHNKRPKHCNNACTSGKKMQCCTAYRDWLCFGSLSSLSCYLSCKILRLLFNTFSQVISYKSANLQA